MPDSVLDILKIVLLVLLYLFFARVLWAVWSEVRQPANGRGTIDFAHAGAPAPTPAAAHAATRQPGRRDQPSRLVVIEPKDRRGTTFALTAALTIGREPDNAIRIDDNFLSGHHASVGPNQDGVVTLTDLGSRNGTFLNANKITEPRSIKTGDRIQIGYTVFEAQS